MKKIKVISALALSILLSACNVNKGISGSKPKFAKMGSEVSYATFMEEFDKADEASEIKKTDFQVGDRILAMKSFSSEIGSVTRGKQVLNKIDNRASEDVKMSFDGDKNIAKMEMVEKTSEYSKNLVEELKASETNKITAQYQVGQYEGNDCFMYADLDGKTYYPAVQLTETMTADYFMNFMGAMSIYSALSSIQSSVPSDEAEAEGWKFYQNGKVFTWVYDMDMEEEMKESETVYAKVKIKGQVKGQIDFTDGKMYARLSQETKITGEYVAEYDGFKVGDKGVEEQKAYVDASAIAKKVDLKEVDLSAYKLTLA